MQRGVVNRTASVLRVADLTGIHLTVTVGILSLLCAMFFTQSALAVESEQQSVQSTDSQTQHNTAVDSNPNDESDQNIQLAPSEFKLLPSLERIHELIDSQAPQLAHSLLIASRHEYESSDNSKQWEELFFKLAFELEDFQGIIDRSRQFSEVADYEFYVAIQMYAVRAEFKLKRFAQARKRLRKMIWDLPYDQQNLIIWRDWIAKSYLDEGLLPEAVTALTAYYLDYRPNDPAWEYKYARVLFLSGNDDEAVRRLEALQSLEARLLRLYSQYKGRYSTPIQIQQVALELQPQLSGSPHLLKELWAIIELNARSMQDFEMQIIAIENALSVNTDTDDESVHFSVVSLSTVEQLLAAYDQYALRVGNEFNLVVGDDASWERLAYEFEITSTTTARAIYSFLARHTSNPDVRSASISALADTLAKDGLVAVMELLFVHKKVLPIADLSDTQQNTLANRAIRRADYAVALSIMNAMKPPQEEGNNFIWRLRQARLAIFIDDFEQSYDHLSEVIENLSFPAPLERIDQIKQVLFDLQEEGQHDQAISLFGKLYRLTADVNANREILRWVADSLEAQQNHAQAADFLLLSASFGDTTNDEWSKSARLKAADVLVDAQLFEDARSIYTQLEQSTFDPRAKAVIRDRLNNLPKTD